MPDLSYYHTIEKESVAEFKDRGSKFLAYAFPVSSKEQFREKLKNLKDEHPKAAHHCFAYRTGTAGTDFRSSDDGEPAGTAGKPILGQIDSNQLTNLGVVVVRYFGGTLLGVPGLINAYKTAASFALQVNPFVRKPVLVNYRLQFDYTLMNEVMMIIKKYNCETFTQAMQLFCLMDIGIPMSSLEDVLLKLKNLHLVEVEVL